VKEASGFALPNQTLFIMGASGAGKTSLLNILSDRISTKNGSRIRGKVLVNDAIELKGSAFGKLASYVMQDDILYKFFTPREALTFAARLKLPQMPIDDQNRRVQNLLEELNLLSAADTMIGSVLTKTISGGEKKRTAIGVELITDP
jgi:ABC-type multidrug transport system ATPase subunit